MHFITIQNISVLAPVLCYDVSPCVFTLGLEVPSFINSLAELTFVCRTRFLCLLVLFCFYFCFCQLPFVRWMDKDFVLLVFLFLCKLSFVRLETWMTNNLCWQMMIQSINNSFNKQNILHQSHHIMLLDVSLENLPSMHFVLLKFEFVRLWN